MATAILGRSDIAATLHLMPRVSEPLATIGAVFLWSPPATTLDHTFAFMPGTFRFAIMASHLVACLRFAFIGAIFLFSTCQRLDNICLETYRT